MNAIDSAIKRTIGKAGKVDCTVFFDSTKVKEVNTVKKYRMIADRALLDNRLAAVLASVDIDTREVLCFLPEKYAPYIVELIGLGFSLADYRNKPLKECVVSLLYQMKKYRTRMATRPTLADSFDFARDYVETRSQYGYAGKVTTATRKGKREYRGFSDLATIAEIVGKDDAETILVELQETARTTVAHWRESLDPATLARVEKFLGLDARKINDGIAVDRITGEIVNYNAKNRKSAERIARLARMTIPEFSNATTADIIKAIALYW